MRKLTAVAALALLAACSGGTSSPSSPSGSGCTLTFAGGASETVACEAVVRPGSGTGYVVTLTASRGAGMSIDQFIAVQLVIDPRPVADVDYGWTASTVPSNIGPSFAERTVDGTTTHYAATAGPIGALTVRLSEIPADDGADPRGWDGIGTVHGTVSGTLVPESGGGADVTVTGAF